MLLSDARGIVMSHRLYRGRLCVKAKWFTSAGGAPVGMMLAPWGTGIVEGGVVQPKDYTLEHLQLEERTAFGEATAVKEN